MTIFNPREVIDNTIIKLKEDIESKTTLVAVSGGVDSATTAVMLTKANVQTRCIFIDTGFMRKNESQEALNLLKENGINAESLLAQDQFFSALSGIKDPREKRLVFRNTYFQIIEKYLRDNTITVLAQGSQSKIDKLKRNYHNVCDNEYINSNIIKIEPLIGLSKSEIRQMAREINLTKDLAERTPFPGPGLLIRFGGEYTEEKLNIIRTATEIVDAFKNNYKSEFTECFQIFPYLCDGSPVTFINKENQTDLGFIIIIRAVTLKNGVYEPFILPELLFKKLTDALIQINGIARICLDMSPKNGTVDKATHGATIEYE